MADLTTDPGPGWRPVRDAGASVTLLLMLLLSSCIDREYWAVEKLPGQIPANANVAWAAAGAATDPSEGQSVTPAAVVKSVPAIEAATEKETILVESVAPRDTAVEEPDPVEELLASGNLSAARVQLTKRSKEDFRYASGEPGRRLWQALATAEEAEAGLLLSAAMKQASETGPTDEVLEQIQAIQTQFGSSQAARQARTHYAKLLATRRETEAEERVAFLEPLLKAGQLKEARGKLTEIQKNHPLLNGTLALRDARQQLSDAEEQHVGDRIRQAMALWSEKKDPQKALDQLQAVLAEFPNAKGSRDARRQEQIIKSELLEQKAAKVFEPVSQGLDRGDLAGAERMLEQLVGTRLELKNSRYISELRARIREVREDRAQAMLKPAIRQQAEGNLPDALQQFRLVATQFPQTQAATDARQREQQIIAKLRENEARLLFGVVELKIIGGGLDTATTEFNKLLKANPELVDTQVVHKIRTTLSEAHEAKAQRLLLSAVELQNRKQYSLALPVFQDVVRQFPNTRAAADARRHELLVKQDLMEQDAQAKLNSVDQLVARGELDKAQQQLGQTIASNRTLLGTLAYRTIQSKLQSAREARAKGELQAATKLQKGGREQEALKQFQKIAQQYSETQAGRNARALQQTVEAAVREREATGKLKAVAQLVNSGQSKRARLDLAAFIRENPELAPTQAVSDVQKSLQELDNRLASAELLEAVRQLESSQPELAIRRLQQIQQDYPATRAASEARQHQRSAESAQRDSKARQALSRVEQLLKQGELVQAGRMLEEAVKSDPTIAASRVTQEVRQQLSAELTREAAERLNDKMAQEQLAAARKAHKAGESAKARSLFEGLVKKFPNSSAASEARKLLKAFFGASKQKDSSD